MASIQDHPKERISKSEIQRRSHAHPQTPASPAVSVISFILCDLRQGRKPLGAAVDSHTLEGTELLQQEYWGKHLSASCVQCHIFIQNPISFILPCLVHPRCKQPCRASNLPGLVCWFFPASLIFTKGTISGSRGLTFICFPSF